MSWGSVSGTLSTNATLSFSESIPSQFLPGVASGGVAVNGPIYLAPGPAGSNLSFFRIGVFSTYVIITAPDLSAITAGSVAIYPGSLSWVVDF